MAIAKVPNLSKFPDCSALSERGRCARLTLNYCQGKFCTFKQSSKEELDSIQSAYQRISSLDISIQTYISEKYYKGTMPWNEEQTPKLQSC